MLESEHHNIYVIELDPAVLTVRKFREANPAYRKGRLCVYVGMTGLSPEERFAKHKAGVKANTYAQKFGLRLCPELYAERNPMSYAKACVWEVRMARQLRNRGYAVWQA